MAKKNKVVAVDAMAIKLGYIATPIGSGALHACRDENKTLKGPYEVEYMGEEVEEEGEQD
jgi:hypothetical protein